MDTSGDAGKMNQAGRSGGKAERKHASAKESDSIKAARIAARAAIIAALISLIGVILGLTLTTGNASPSGNQPTGGGTPTFSSALQSRLPTTRNPGAGPARTSNSPTGATGLPMYQDQGFVLGGDGCNNTYIYRYFTLGQHGLIINNLGTTSALSSPLGVELFCSPNSNGGVFDPNLQWGGQAAILTGGAGFGSCYSAITNSPISNILQFDQLRSGFHLCIFYPQDNELALVTLNSVYQTSYRVAGTVTVWKVLTPSN